MDWQRPRWAIPLQTQPQLVQIGLSAHRGKPKERYFVPDLWQVHIYRYRATLRVQNDLLGREWFEFPIRPGHASVLAPQSGSEYHHPGRSPYVFAHFRLPPPSANSPTVPVMQDLGPEAGELNQRFESAVACFSTHRWRAQIILWDILARLWERSSSPAARAHPAVDEIRQFIELHVGEPLRVSDLARRVDLSHSHLIRLFRAAVGTTIKGYIQQRRVERARHLLLHSTRPIKAIANEVGIADLHLFNKTIRRALGQSPRALRER